MDAALQRALEAQLNTRLLGAQRVRGGDINQAFKVVCADGSRLFVKHHPSAPAGMFRAEAHGLEWLTQTATVRVPAVRLVHDRAPAFLVLEWLQPDERAADFDERLGRELAALHRASSAHFGLAHANFIAVLPQDNTPTDSWPEFYRARRLEPQLRLAVDAGRATRSMTSGFERLFARLHGRVEPCEPPARLHGDLWGGNVMVGPQGLPYLIDPAVYAGQREVDLAMMELFGGFSRRTFDAYHEAYPLTPGHAQRMEIYQLYPLMVHVNLFGGGYAAQVEAILARV